MSHYELSSCMLHVASVVEMPMMLSGGISSPGTAMLGALSPWWRPNPTHQCFLAAPSLVVGSSWAPHDLLLCLLAASETRTQSQPLSLWEKTGPLCRVINLRFVLLDVGSFPYRKLVRIIDPLLSPGSLQGTSQEKTMSQDWLGHYASAGSCQLRESRGVLSLWSGQRILLSGLQ